MVYSMSSPGSSSSFHLGTAIPFIYQDFMCRYDSLKGSKYDQVIALNELGLRTFDTKIYLENIKKMNLKWSGRKISDSNKEFYNFCKLSINKLINTGCIQRQDVPIFICPNNRQIFLSPGENYSLKLVEKQNCTTNGFVLPKIGWVSILDDHHLNPKFIGIGDVRHDLNSIISTPLGNLKVKIVPGLRSPTIFYKESVYSKSFDVNLNKRKSVVYKCKFCGHVLIPIETQTWTINFKKLENFSFLSGAIPLKHWQEIAKEINNTQIISRNRATTGISTIEINHNLGIENSILDPEFYIQFLPMYLAHKSGTAVKSLFISEVNQKYIINSLKLYQLFHENIIDHFYVVGILMGKNHLTMRKSNKNVVGLQESIDSYGIDAVRIFAAKSNLLVKRSRAFNKSDLIGAKRFVQNLLQKFENGSLVEHCDIEQLSNIMIQRLEKKMKDLDFAGAIRQLETFLRNISGDIPIDKQEQSNLLRVFDYLECFCPNLAQKLKKCCYLKLKRGK